MQQQELIVSAI